MQNNNGSNKLDVQSERLKMRRPTAEDADDILSFYASDPDVTKYLPFAPHKTLQDSLEFIRWSDEQWERHSFCFIICSKANMKLIGGIGLAFDDGTRDVARLGYCFAKDEWGKGYATEACKRIMDLAKESGVRKLVAPVHPDNIASIRVLEKCGFQEDLSASETYFFPNLGKRLKLIGLCRSLSMSIPPPNMMWEA
ncbi:hypothetical protein HJC23_000960 [Cyclotella cryptica]|uniref:N-acetyltransferase domain-containing protein n=1 Tax=Cyclotella cryptica TaxID=29204 RepID=A0ABD3QMB0_9STRA